MKIPVSILALAVMSTGLTCVSAQSQDDIKQARKLRAEAAYTELKGDKDKAIELYEKSLGFVKDEAIQRKLAELKGESTTVKELQAADEAAKSDLPDFKPSAELEAGTVFSKLDLNPFMMGYFNGDTLIPPLRTQIIDFLKTAAGTSSDAEANVEAIHKIDAALEWLGLYEIKGIGFSLAPLSANVSRSKMYVEFDKPEPTGAIWKLSRANTKLDSLNLFPKDTVLAASGSLSLKEVWKLVDEALLAFAPPELREQKNAQIAQIKEAMGIDIEALIASTADELLMGLALSETTRIDLPMPDGSIANIPEPSLMFGMEVSDSSIMDMIRKLIEEKQIPVSKSDLGGAEMISFPIPLPLPIRMEVAIIQAGDYLLIGTQSALIQNAVASMNGSFEGLVSSAEFKQYMGDLPESMSGASFVGSRFYKEYFKVYGAIITKNQATDPNLEKLAPLMDKLNAILKTNENNASAAYQVSDRDGMLCVSYSRTPEYNPIVAGAVQAVSMGVATAAIEAEKNRLMQDTYTCQYNQSMIENAKNEWANEHDLTEGTPSWEDLTPYLDDNMIPVCPSGGTYTIGSLQEPVSCSVDGHTIEQAPVWDEEDQGAEADTGDTEVVEEAGVE